jgi:hypothetical protein
MNIQRLIDQHYQRAADLEAQAQAHDAVAQSLEVMVARRLRRRIYRHNHGEQAWPPLEAHELVMAELAAIEEREHAEFCKERDRWTTQAPTQTTWNELMRRI